MNRKITTATAVAAALAVTVAANVLINNTSNRAEALVLDEEIYELMNIDEPQGVFKDALDVSYRAGEAADTVTIDSVPDTYTDETKTLLIVVPEADLSDIAPADIIAIEQRAEITEVLLQSIDAETGAGTYTVLMGGSEGNIYTGTFTVDAPVPSQSPSPTPTPSHTPTSSPYPTPSPTPIALDEEEVLMTYDDGTVTVISGRDLDATLIFAEYNGTSLVSVEAETVNAKANTEFTATQKDAAAEGSTVKILLWDDLVHMKPLHKPITGNKNRT